MWGGGGGGHVGGVDHFSFLPTYLRSLSMQTLDQDVFRKASGVTQGGVLGRMCNLLPWCVEGFMSQEDQKAATEAAAAGEATRKVAARSALEEQEKRLEELPDLEVGRLLKEAFSESNPV